MTDFMGTFVCTFGYFDFLDFYFSRKPINRSTNLRNKLIDNQALYQSSFFVLIWALKLLEYSINILLSFDVEQGYVISTFRRQHSSRL